jgi:restriction endonuclease S subunit
MMQYSSKDYVKVRDALTRKKFYVGKLDTSDYADSGRFPIIDQGRTPIAGYTDREDLLYDGPLPVIVFGDHTRALKFVDQRFVTGADGTRVVVPDLTRFDPLYFYFALCALDVPSRGYNRHWGLLREMMVARPPLDEQRQIARILSIIREASHKSILCADKTAMLGKSLFGKLFPKSIDEVPNRIFGHPASWALTTVGEELALQRGFDITRKDQRTGSIPVVSSSGIKSFHDTAMATGPGVVIGRKGSLGTAHYVATDYWPHDTTLWVTDFKGNCPKFVYYFLRQLDVSHLDVGASNPTLNRNHLYPTSIVWPDLASQHRIVTALDTVEKKEGTDREVSAAIEGIFRSTMTEFIGVPEKS